MKYEKQLAEVSGATLGYIGGNLPGAYIGYKVAKRAYKSKEGSKKLTRKVEKMMTPDQTPQKRGRSLTRSASKNRSVSKSRSTKSMSLSRSRSKSRSRSLSTVRSAAGKKSVGGSSMVTKPPTKLKKKTESFYKYQKRGVEFHIETTSVYSNAEAAYFLVHNMPTGQATKIAAYAWLKALCLKAGIEITTVNDTVSFAGASQRVEFAYKLSNSGGLSLSNYDCTGKKFYEIADVIHGWFYGAVGYAHTWVPVYLRFFQYSGTGDQITLGTINLTGGTLFFKSNAYFKYQNRTIFDTGDDTTEDVDRQPLRGTIYSGKGNGTRLKGRSDLPGLFANYLNGVKIEAYPLTPVAGVPADVGGDYSLTTGKQFFMDCKQSSKFVLDPGNIQIVKLSTEKAISIDKFGLNVEDIAVDAKRSLGEFKLIFLDKIISFAGSAVNPFKVAWEQEMRIACYYKEPSSTATRPYGQKVAY